MKWDGLLSSMTATVRDTFGEPVSYWKFGTPTAQWITQTVDGAPLMGVYDPDHASLEAGGDVGVNATMQILEMRVADLGFTPDEEDRVIVQGTTYKLVNVFPSSSGMRKLHLRKVK